MNCTRLAAAGIAATALGFVVPSLASAADYCVAPNYDCGANNVQKLEDALDIAASTKEADRVLLGEGTYVAPPIQKAFSYTRLDSPVEIVGAGRGRTVLTAKPFSIDKVLYLAAGPDSSVHDLTIQMPEKVGGDFRGMWLGQESVARRIEVVDTSGQADSRYGAALYWGAILEDSTITLRRNSETTGVGLSTSLPGEPASTVRGTTITAKRGIQVERGGAVERTRVFAEDRGLTASGGEVKLANSLFSTSASAGSVIRAETQAGWNTRVTADGLTVIGGNTIDVAGIVATTAPADGQNVEVSVANSVVRGAFASLGALANGNGTARIASSYSDYDPYEDAAFGNAHIDENHATNIGDASFVDPANGDYRLKPGSPLVDKGDPDVAQGLDIDGNPLLADGNGDGFARRDLGAFELQPPAPEPQPQADTQAPVISGFRARRSAVSYRLSERARVIVKVQRRLAGKRARYRTLGKVAKGAVQGTNRLRLTRRIRARAAHPGRYRAVIVAVDAAGNRSAKKTATFRVTR